MGPADKEPLESGTTQTGVKISPTRFTVPSSPEPPQGAPVSLERPEAMGNSVSSPGLPSGGAQSETKADLPTLQAANEKSAGDESRVPKPVDSESGHLIADVTTLPEELQTRELETHAPGIANALWRYQPLPDDPEPHPESHSQSEADSNHLKAIGARVRGKMHKHEGTNCDDWFELKMLPPWTILAVADGAGSYKFSRIGAHAATSAAIVTLASALREIRIKERIDWTKEAFSRDSVSGAFGEQDLEAVQIALHSAVASANKAIKSALELREGQPEYEAIVGRKLVARDFACTLLLAVHATVPYRGGTGSLIMSCHVGDGFIFVMDERGVVHPLAELPLGEFAGGTDLVHDERWIDHQRLARKTFPFIGSMRSLMLMTDGVSDDYVPPIQKLAYLYGDLVLNQVLPYSAIGRVCDQGVEPEHRIDDLESFSYIVESPNRNGIRRARVRSFAKLVEKTGLSPSDILSRPKVVDHVLAGEPLCTEKEPERKLEAWLDSYQKRGSFDDRTLLILYSEGDGED